MKAICIIPARGGSKRIPRKNIADFSGKPIVTHSIETALQSGLFDEVMCSTDDAEIAAIARQSGASVPVLRSNQNANDFATLADVLIEVVSYYQTQGQTPGLICCLLPTAPLITPDDLCNAHKQMLDEQKDAICPVVPFSYPIQRALRINEQQSLEMMHPEYSRSRSQDLPPAYHDAGAFYWINVQTLLEEKTLFSRNCGAYILDEMHVQDIDTPTDWKLAELKHKLLHA